MSAVRSKIGLDSEWLNLSSGQLMTRSAPGVIIAGTGSYAPSRIVTNEEISAQVDTSDEWIRTRTGIRERRFAEDHEYTSIMGAKAAEAAMEDAGVSAIEIDLIIVATLSPDMLFPSMTDILAPVVFLAAVLADWYVPLNFSGIWIDMIDL